MVIVIDQGRGMSASQLSTAKQVAKHVLESLQQTDKVYTIVKCHIAT